MAVKKKSPEKDKSATPTKASAAKDSAKTSTKKKSAAKPKAKAEAKAPKKGAKPKAAPVKLSSSQHELLKKVHGAGETGYSADKKVEERSLTALQEKKLVKKGAKDKATGKVPYSVSSAGKKHVESQGVGGAGSAPGSSA